MKPWRLDQVKYSDVKDNLPEVLVLPLGATEPHNFHLPYGTDSLTVDLIGDIACEKAHKQGAKVLLLPTMPYGVDTNLMKFPLPMSIDPSTLDHVITDLVESAEIHGIKKFVLLNGHGGNSLKHTLRELYGKTSVFLSLVNWYQTIGEEGLALYDDPGDHAGDLETSVGLYFWPQLIDLSLADDGAERKPKLEAVKQGWVQITRPWHLATTNSGVGYPHDATKEKGEKTVEIVTDRIANYLKELSDLPMSENFPYE